MVTAPSPEVEAAPPQLRVVDPETGQLTLNPHPGQFRTMESLARFVFLLIGSQGGKTSWIPHWLHAEMKKTWSSDPRAINDYIACTTTFDQFSLKMLPEMLEVFEDILKIGRYWTGSKTMELREGLDPDGGFRADKASEKMWGRIVLRSAEALTGLEALTAKAAALDEFGQKDFTYDAWKAIRARLTLARGRILGTSSLYQAGGWQKTEIYDRWEKGNPNYEVIQYDSTINPAFATEEFEELRAEMPEWEFNLRYRGRYSKRPGLIYDSFDEAACVVDEFPIPDDWPVIVGHDFGAANPAALIIAFNPKEDDPLHFPIYIVDEYLPGVTAVPDQIRELETRTKGMNVIRRVGGSHQEQDSRGNYSAHGWHILEPSIPDVEVGISRVYAFHKRNAIGVFRRCRRYLDQKMSYSRDTGDGFEVLDTIRSKARYHLLDCERYALCGFLVDRPRSRKPRTVHRAKF